MYFYPHSGIQIPLAGAQFQNHVIRILLAGGGSQNIISGRENHQSPTQGHQNIIGGREDRQRPCRAIRILLAGGRTVQVSTHAIRILLAGRRTVQVSTHAIRILVAGGRTVAHPWLPKGGVLHSSSSTHNSIIWHGLQCPK